MENESGQTTPVISSEIESLQKYMICKPHAVWAYFSQALCYVCAQESRKKTYAAQLAEAEHMRSDMFRRNLKPSE